MSHRRVNTIHCINSRIFRRFLSILPAPHFKRMLANCRSILHNLLQISFTGHSFVSISSFLYQWDSSILLHRVRIQKFIVLHNVLQYFIIFPCCKRKCGFMQGSLWMFHMWMFLKIFWQKLHISGELLEEKTPMCLTGLDPSNGPICCKFMPTRVFCGSFQSFTYSESQ